VTIKTINDLKPDPNNANRGTERGHRIVNNSIQRHGAGRSGLAARDGTMIAGSQTLEEMAALGMKIKPVHTTGDEWVVVIRDDVEPGSEQATLMGLEDNRGAQEGIEWDPGILAELAQQFDVSGLFTGDELAEWAQPSEPEAGAGGDEFDTTPDEGGETRAQLGDLWIIGGKHRLLVGDCTDAANVARLMGGERAALCFTDTPYNVEYQANESIESLKARNRRTDGKIVENDDTADVAVQGVAQMFAVLQPGGAMYICFPAEQPDVLAQMWCKGTHLQSMIVWAKDRIVMGRKDHHYQHEPIWYGWKEGAAHSWYGGHTQSTVWHVARPFDSEDHPTEKPLELPFRAITNSSKTNDVVIDFFAGSGVTLTAAHRQRRRAYLMELSPKYADVILRRAEAEGLTVERADA